MLILCPLLEDMLGKKEEATVLDLKEVIIAHTKAYTIIE